MALSWPSHFLFILFQLLFGSDMVSSCIPFMVIVPFFECLFNLIRFRSVSIFNRFILLASVNANACVSSFTCVMTFNSWPVGCTLWMSRWLIFWLLQVFLLTSIILFNPRLISDQLSVIYECSAHQFFRNGTLMHSFFPTN